MTLDSVFDSSSNRYFDDVTSNPNDDCDTIPFSQNVEFPRLSLEDNAATESLDIESTKYMRLIILNGEIGTNDITLQSENTDLLDPYLAVFRVCAEETPAADQAACVLIASNDDYRGDYGLNSRILAYLQPGHYILSLGQWHGAGPATVTVNRVEQ